MKKGSPIRACVAVAPPRYAVSRLREAYPNYHADTEQFLAELMSRAIEPFIESYEESGKLDWE